MCNSCCLIYQYIDLCERELKRDGRGFGKESWIDKMERRVKVANLLRAPAGLPLLYIFCQMRAGRIYYGVTMQGYGSMVLAQERKHQVCGAITVVDSRGEMVMNEYRRRLKIFWNEAKEEWEPVVVCPGFEPEYLQHLPPPPPPIVPPHLPFIVIPAGPPTADEGIDILPSTIHEEEEDWDAAESEVPAPLAPPRRVFDWNHLEQELERVAAEQQQREV